MAYDETSFLSGIALGRAMKGISMANPNRGDFLRVLSGRLAAARIVALRPETVPGFSGDSAAVVSFLADLNGQLIRAAAAVPGVMGLGSLGAAAVLNQEGERLYASAALPGELTDAFSAALRKKAADRSLPAAEMPGGLGGLLQAGAAIAIED